MKKLLLLLMAGLLWSCDTSRSYGPDSSYFPYPNGGSFVLNQVLEIPAGRATARIQFGKLVAFGSVQEQEPHCIFEINTVRDVPQLVSPDRFVIVGVEREVSDFAGAGRFYFFRGAYAGGVDDGPTQIFYKTVFRLKSELQSGVLQMTCQVDRKPTSAGIARHLTVPDISHALGRIFTLELP